MAIRIPWSLTESVILLDALIAYLDGKITSKSLIADVSSFLRKYAVYRGIEIDDKFRNENGIAMQFRVMEYYFTGGKRGLKKDQCPKIFQETIDLYHQDRKDFERVLQEAKAMDKYDHVDFMNLQDYVYTKPYEYLYAGETIQVTSWRMLYMSVVKCLLRDYPDKILSLKNGSITRSGSIDICDSKSVYRLRTAGKLSDDLYIEVNLSAKNIAQRIKYLLDMCHVPYSNLVIRLKKDDPNAPKEQTKPGKKKVTAVGSSPVDRPVQTLSKPQTPASKQPVFRVSAKKTDHKSVDFTIPASYSFTLPIQFVYFGEVHSVKTWKEVYTGVLACLLEDYPNDDV